MLHHQGALVVSLVLRLQHDDLLAVIFEREILNLFQSPLTARITHAIQFALAAAIILAVIAL